MPQHADQDPPAPRRSRRASRPAPEGTDPHPGDHPLDSAAAEDQPEGWGDGAGTKRRSAAKGADQGGAENDARLIGDKPPHWG
ncbi:MULTISPECIES: hypothetical protein [unclassified Leucobacter]|uniref:hypothetical protein n=1 Tax=unclassified Leucobacter TaxID=2621730 RepID=UPI00165D37A2|nr:MULTISPECIES: hypothetical protein [unclassified Leucobacter]MBC9928500.1 hypothetical protein [Leucobacter sp. cx-169]